MTFNPDPKKPKREAKAKKPLKRTAISKVSKKRSKENREYLKLRAEYLEANPVCEFENCESPATEIHHKNSRHNQNLFKGFMAICRPHHNICHDQNLKM